MPDQRITMTVNKDWWDKLDGNVTEVIYTPIKSDATRVAALLSGDVDMLTDLPTQDVARLRADTKLKVLDGPEVRTIYLAPDVGSPELKYSNVKGKNPFADKRVRQALSMAIDRDAIKRNIMRGLSIPAGVMVAPGVNGNAPDIDVPIKADTEAAKKLLADAGYPNGFEIQLNCPNNRYVNDEEICQAVLAMWARIGVKAKLAAENMATFIQKVQNFDTSIYLLGWGVATYDAQYTLQSLVRTPRRRAGRQLQLLAHQRPEGRPAGRRDEDRDRRRQAQRDDQGSADAHPRRGAADSAAPPDAPVGDEGRRDDRAPLGRPPGVALRQGQLTLRIDGSRGPAGPLFFGGAAQWRKVSRTTRPLCMSRRIPVCGAASIASDSAGSPSTTSRSA